tara:strand:+ start:602 stop:1060 length:459 start_codon:yes stop_codon:yes gene_type:complete
MAKYAIFTSTNAFYKIAESEDEKNAIIQYQPLAKSVIITDEQFSFIKKSLQDYCPKSFDGTTITWGTGSTEPFIEGPIAIPEQSYRNLIDLWKLSVKEWIDNHPDHAHYAKWKTYYDYLNTFNYSSISFPTTVDIMDYLEANTTWYNPLQLP